MRFKIVCQQEQEEPNDSEVEPNEEYPQQPASKVSKEVVSEIVSTTITEQQTLNTLLADEEAVNKVVEKIDTLRMGPRQVIKVYNI